MINSQHSTRRLALSYFAIIMTMSVIFSAVIYLITSSHLSRPFPPPEQNGARTLALPLEVSERIESRDAQTRLSLLSSLIIINVLVGGTGAWFSYYLARRTLSPIEESIEKQNQFISDASHELRTPLTALQTSNEVALRKIKITEEKARQVFESNIAETEKLRQLSDDLLNLTKVSREEKKEIRLDKFIANIVSKLKPIADRESVAITTNIPKISVQAPPVALEQIITNLLENAIKYSLKDSCVKIDVKQEGSQVLISVQDNGPGIPKDKQTQIFERFYQLDAARTRSTNSGHGLGLAIVKELAERYGYTIKCISEPKKGSTFILNIK